jgi:hypothetical protein
MLASRMGIALLWIIPAAIVLAASAQAKVAACFH